MSGDIVTPFFGVALATDIRYATPDMFFSMAHIKYGLHPSGGLPYFLVHELGYNKAMELLLRDKISAQEALSLGLINKIIDEKEPLPFVINEIKKLINIRSCTLRRTKQLTSLTRKSLNEYFTNEETLINV